MLGCRCLQPCPCSPCLAALPLKRACPPKEIRHDLRNVLSISTIVAENHASLICDREPERYRCVSRAERSCRSCMLRTMASSAGHAHAAIALGLVIVYQAVWCSAIVRSTENAFYKSWRS